MLLIYEDYFFIIYDIIFIKWKNEMNEIKFIFKGIFFLQCTNQCNCEIEN